jgi:hypothetical protein
MATQEVPFVEFPIPAFLMIEDMTPERMLVSLDWSGTNS